jgi:hypothetical protein
MSGRPTSSRRSFPASSAKDDGRQLCDAEAFRKVIVDQTDGQRGRYWCEDDRVRAASALRVVVAVVVLFPVSCSSGSPPVPTEDLSGGLISGRLLVVGGPNNARFPVKGVVTVEGSGRAPIPVGSRGRYSIVVPPGRYVLSGRSPNYNDGKGRCEAASPVTVRNGAEISVDVLCQMR